MPSLAGARWLREPSLGRIFEALEREGGSARVVGGAVRNALIGRPVSEVDIATTVLPEDVIRLAGVAGLKAVPTGIEHGTVTVVSDHHPYEVTTLRRDVETDGRRAVVAFTTDWREDAERRDFTMNALYAALDGTLSDPIGGYCDLDARHVRFIGDARTRIREDYLRILRLFRFHAEIGLGPIDEVGLAAARELKGGLADLSRERIRQEFLRLLAASGAPAALQAMHGIGIFEVIGLVRVDLERVEHLAAIEAAQGGGRDAVLRLAALALSPDAGQSADALADRLRLSNDERKRLDGLAGWQEVSPALDETARRERIYRAGTGAVRNQALMAWAASGAAPGDAAWAGLVTLVADWRPPVFPLKGRDLVELGVRRGPDLGTMLKQLEGQWILGGFAADRDDLIALARDLVSGAANPE